MLRALPIFLLLAAASADSSGQKAAKALPLVGSQGIVVPKRSALISGLNHQFKLLQGDKQQQQQQAANATSSAPSAASAAGATPTSQPFLKNPAHVLAELGGFHWLGSRVGAPAGKRPKPGSQAQRNQLQQQQQALYLDRHQQQILAANPNLLNPSSVPSALLTRSDPTVQAPPESKRPAQSAANLTLAAGGKPAGAAEAQPPKTPPGAGAEQTQLGGQQQLYRGFSLIELEVKTEPERRYIQDLYANLSAAINEQAAQASATVSPYVDVDFWSFKYALNDHIDIMVSPKSRSFILGQLNRAKIRHRVKIDDIQARLDAQQAAGAQQLGAADAQLSGRGAGDSAAPPGGKQRSDLNARQAQDQAGGQAQARPLNDTQFFDNYQRLADINAYLESLVERNREVARVQVIGRSSQGRYLRVLKLGYDDQEFGGRSLAAPADEPLEQRAAASSAPGSTPAPPVGAAASMRQLNNASAVLEAFFRRHEAVQKVGAIWLDGGTHAREWISPSTVLYIAFRLADNHNRCARFFERLRVAARDADSAAALELELLEQQARQRRAMLAPSVALDAQLLSGINEINSSLLGKPVKPGRARTELERTLELLAKSPQEVASEHGCELQLEQLLRRYTFYLEPVLNPDGYEYSHTHNRLWRKTRSTSAHPIYRHFCLGADPNRNYDARHGTTGSSSHPCSQTYAGSVPFTEPETKHQSNFVYANRAQMKMFISFHSYSQMILLPFSHSKQLAPDHKDLESVGLAAVKAIEATHGTQYKVGPSASILYTASGTASDWAYEKAGVKYSYTIELRDTGSFGFLLPRQQILPTGEETFNGLLAMIGQMEKNERLLTSKSAGLALQAGGQQAPVAPANSSEPDFDKLRPLSKQAAKPGLENVHVGSSSWAQLDAGLQGVRDRKPMGPLKEPIGSLILPESEPANDVTENSLSGEPLIGHRPYVSPRKPASGHHAHLAAPEDPLEAPDDENAPDSGYAFEGEGELMEPTRENLIEASKLNAELKSLSGRHDHSRRISQAAGLAPSGRNFINSPLLKSRIGEAPVAPRRESSNDLANLAGEGL